MCNLLKALALLALCMPALSSAVDVWGNVNLASIHGHTRKPMNERNFGLGLEFHTSPDVLYLVGGYRNSYRRNTGYALAGWTPLQIGGVRFGVLAGAANGYPKLNNGHIAPALAGIMRLEKEGFGANVVLIPPALKNSPWTLGFQFKFKF